MDINTQNWIDSGGTSPTTLNYQGYRAMVQYDPTEGTYSGRVLNIKREVVVFRAYGAEQAVQHFELAIEQYLDRCAAAGVEPEK